MRGCVRCDRSGGRRREIDPVASWVERRTSPCRRTHCRMRRLRRIVARGRAAGMGRAESKNKRCANRETALKLPIVLRRLLDAYISPRKLGPRSAAEPEADQRAHSPQRPLAMMETSRKKEHEEHRNHEHHHPAETYRPVERALVTECSRCPKTLTSNHRRQKGDAAEHRENAES